VDVSAHIILTDNRRLAVAAWVQRGYPSGRVVALRVSDRDDDLALGNPVLQMAEGFGQFTQGVGSIDEWHEFPASRNSSRTAIESLLVGIQKFGACRWLTNGDITSSLRTRGRLPNHRPAELSPPTST
jgi:hypothetical protein